jgi:hypothetical protein
MSRVKSAPFRVAWVTCAAVTYASKALTSASRIAPVVAPPTAKSVPPARLGLSTPSPRPAESSSTQVGPLLKWPPTYGGGGGFEPPVMIEALPASERLSPNAKSVVKADADPTLRPKQATRTAKANRFFMAYPPRSKG